MYVNVKMDKLESETQKCDSQIETFASEIRNLKKTIEDMNIIWKEKDYQNFATKVNEFAKDLEEMQGQIESYNNFIKGYIETEKKMDEEYKNKKIKIK